jgi:hypothetical protein
MRSAPRDFARARRRVMADEGIEVRHAAACRSHTGGRCSCEPTYRASIWSNRERKRIRRFFQSRAAAKVWRQDAAGSVRRGELRAAAAPTLADAITELLGAIDAGTFRTRGRRPFKPTTRRAVAQNYRLRLKDRFARSRLDSLQLQDFIDDPDAAGTNPSTIEAAIPAAPPRLPLDESARHRHDRPDRRPRLPQKPSRQRVPPSPADAARLLAAVPEPNRPTWATAMLAGLRRGEILALALQNVDLSTGVRRVERSYDPTTGLFRSTASGTCQSPEHSRPTSASMPSAQAAAKASSSAQPPPAHSPPAASRTEPMTPGASPA